MKNHYKFWIVFSLIVVFIAGVLSGILLEQHFIHKRMIKKRTERKPERRSSVRFPTLEMMAEELGLTPEQEEQIREIFRNNEERMKELSSSFREHYSKMRSQLRSDIKSVLSEEQSQKFDAMVEKYISQRKKEMEERRKRSKNHRPDRRDEKTQSENSRNDKGAKQPD